jgi:hypothetical protein
VGAPAGASVSADIAALKTDVDGGVKLLALDSAPLESGTAQAGAAGSITLRSGASATDNLYRGQEIEIYGGTGAGQARVITGYTGSSKVATVDENWITNPSTDSLYRIKHRSPKLNSSLQTTDVNSANLDAAVSTRSTYAGADTSGTTTLLSRLSSTRAGNLDNLDATTSSRMATFTLPTNFSSLAIDGSGRVTLAPQQIVAKKNAAFNLFFVMTDQSTHAPKTSVTVTAKRSIDGAALGAASGTVTEIGDGLYMLAAAAGDMNGNSIAFEFSGTGADTRFMFVATQP